MVSGLEGRVILNLTVGSDDAFEIRTRASIPPRDPSM